ncbi:hypothetical protein VOLCADRAFT_96395 [Volvox carteri f. nagariensis]|uniref:Transmembrane protein n=1 Tax=Volvox carteri f. nagariensis TaxID=3068 RepID=D8UA01_VOLCA|nr:uncharacterized protein VOLCADRAFT_96395 [Volvox carteri f. nagariensis]EFJ43501.1 hypothetical protein VOLCADRAFT_96395 [Volvox carteri f. nagariensis]|eukprot:XP_002955430.1 hypothetical protein VOLCADRAFT_96395 [Volvox carteri f. nagariensis]
MQVSAADPIANRKLMPNRSQTYTRYAAACTSSWHEPLRQRRPFSLRAGEGSGGPQLTPITPPQWYAAPSVSGGLGTTPFNGTPATPGIGGSLLAATPATGAEAALLRTPLSDPFRRSPQPLGMSPGGAVVASPEQLTYYLESLGGTTSAGFMASPQHPDSLAGQYGGVSQTSPAYGVASDQDQATSGVLPVGVNAPYYRMTWMPKKAAAAAAADTPTLNPSSPEEVEEFVVTVLRARQEWLELWTERLREWLAGRVLKPLVAAVVSAHEPVNALLQQFNQSPRLPPLPDIVSDVRSAGVVDVDGVLRSLQTSLSQHVAAQPAAAMTPKAKELLAAVNRYADLLAVLRGKRPSDILPPSNTAYVWTRIQQLAESSCLKEFTWNGGAAYAGRPWSADQLPNDSALVLYLFAAYLDAPGWQFTAPPNTQAEGGTQPLYLGTLPSGPRSSAACSALLTYRPERHGKDMDALLGLQLQGTTPLFCYMAAGRLMVLANWYQYVGVFHAIIFFLQYHKVRYNGAIGRQQMDDPDLALDAVVQPPPVGAVVSLGGRVLGGLGWFM